MRVAKTDAGLDVRGNDVEERRKVIAALDYPGFEIVSPDSGYPMDQLADLMAIDSEVCVFWSDDGNPWARTSCG
jgi:hypothetical protein